MEIVIAELTEAVDHLDAAIHQIKHGRAKRELDNGQDLETLIKLRDELNYQLTCFEDKYSIA